MPHARACRTGPASYDGALTRDERNARLGDGSANFCDRRVWTAVEHHKRAPFLGDTAFNSSRYEVVTMQDVLDDCAMRSFAGLSWLEKLLPDGQYSELRDAQAADFDALTRMIEGVDEILDRMDLLYVEEYIPRRLLPWREYYAARGFTVQEPLLDNDILEFARRLPPDLRRRKRLYVEAATALDPELFVVPRAKVSGCYIDWRSELRRHAATLTAAGTRGGASGASLLDDVIDPAIVGATLALPHFRGDGQTGRHTARRVLQRIERLNRTIGGRQLPLRVGPVEFLLRYLVLRRFLEVSAPDSLLTRLQAADQVP